MKKQITKVYLTKTSLTTQILHNEKDDHKKIKIVTTNNYTGLTIPPQLSQENYPPLTTNKNQSDSQQINTNIQSSQHKTIIKETPISQQPINKENDIDFLTPPVVSKPFRSTTLKPIDTPTPTTTQIQTS